MMKTKVIFFLQEQKYKLQNPFPWLNEGQTPILGIITREMYIKLYELIRKEENTRLRLVFSTFLRVLKCPSER